mmetsp:Transcript_56786/g.178320  ORF Transcript_56786/g.178320 Transcript_56786/m.178320 type:complete len:325 (+) Transcript_56786:3-977(+)
MNATLLVGAGPHSGAPDLCEGDGGSGHDEGLEDEVAGQRKDEVADAADLPALQRAAGVLVPLEEERVRCADVVRRLRLLHGEPVVLPVARPDQPQRRVRAGVPVVRAVEPRSGPRAAVPADRPEVVRNDAGPGACDRSHTEHVEVPEAHGLTGVNPGLLCEYHTAGVQELLPADPGGIHTVVVVEAGHLVVRQREELVVEDAEDRSDDECQEERHRLEDHPRGLSLRLVGGPGRRPRHIGAPGMDHHSDEEDDEYEVDDACVRVVDLEGQEGEAGHEDDPRHEEGDEDRQDVQATPLPPHEGCFGASRGGKRQGGGGAVGVRPT